MMPVLKWFKKYINLARENGTPNNEHPQYYQVLKSENKMKMCAVFLSKKDFLPWAFLMDGGSNIEKEKVIYKGIFVFNF